ncbi:DUF5799 family protein [Halorhabdus rudnickae]|uniref:DUF5799 family protein n=1 Tax=Halorhabdus rudnickae TaxID=1775544 RepID=UPI0010846370|nr:DUF5799 family protein [Halorhabdus rudnickae]
MSSDSWSEQIATERMQTDQEFADRVEASPLSNQQWGLVMTAVEFEIDGPEDPDSARLVADTSRLSSVMDEIKRMDERGGGAAMSAGSGTSSGESGGLFSGLKNALGFEGGNDQLREAAEELAEEYVDQLQSRLEKRGRWANVCELARDT